MSELFEMAAQPSQNDEFRASRRIKPLTDLYQPVSFAQIFFTVLSGKKSRMAKSNTIVVKLLSTADTGYFYVAKKNPRTQTEKLEFRKYDPVARRHVAFRESKIK